MMSNHKFSFLLIACIWLAMASLAAAAHPYHVSLTEIDWNPNSGAFEVAVCVWPADLEKALAQQQSQPIDLDNTEGLDAIITSYVSQKIGCSNGNDIAKLRWVGFETTNKKSWVYFELKPTNKATVASGNWSLENKMFFELNDDQQNFVTFTNGSGQRSGHCSAASSRFDLKP